MEKKRIYLSSPTMHGEEQAFINEAFATNWVAPLGPNAVSYTHLDVYKRQPLSLP